MYVTIVEKYVLIVTYMGTLAYMICVMFCRLKKGFLRRGSEM